MPEREIERPRRRHQAARGLRRATARDALDDGDQTLVHHEMEVDAAVRRDTFGLRADKNAIVTGRRGSGGRRGLCLRLLDGLLCLCTMSCTASAVVIFAGLIGSTLLANVPEVWVTILRLISETAPTRPVVASAGE